MFQETSEPAIVAKKMYQCQDCGIYIAKPRKYNKYGVVYLLCNKCYVKAILQRICEELEKRDIAYEFEHRFDSNRRYRFDLALPKHNIAIEIDGGVYIKSGHSGGSNIEKSMIRGNIACMNGWFVLHYTPRMALAYEDVVEEIEAAILTMENKYATN